MKSPGEDGYDFPCGDSHSCIDYVYGGPNGIMKNKKIYFGNHKSGSVYNKTHSEVLKFKKELEEQLILINLWLKDPETRG